MKHAFRLIGALGTILCVSIFLADPSFPTPDKLVIFLTFVFMIFGQAWQMLKRIGPFVVILLTYDSFRSLVPSLNAHVHYTLMPHFDTNIFGTLPTITLQHWLWHGHVQWYDFVFYSVYMLHFVVPIALALLIWKLRDELYWTAAATYIFVSFTAFAVFLLYPTAPPWLASQDGYIPHLTRVSSDIYAAMGIHNFPSLYNHLSPNPVAAVPSLHTAYSILFSLFIWKLFGRKWGIASLIYPALMITGVIYMGEHYAFDVATGGLLAVLGFVATPFLLRHATRFGQRAHQAIRRRLWADRPA